MKNNYQEIKSKNLDHLGIIVGIIDEIGIVEKIDKIVGNVAGSAITLPAECGL